MILTYILTLSASNNPAKYNMYSPNIFFYTGLIQTEIIPLVITAIVMKKWIVLIPIAYSFLFFLICFFALYIKANRKR